MSAPEKQASTPQVDAKVCAGCHADQAKAFTLNPHASTASSCTSCHTTATEHLAKPGKETMAGFAVTAQVQAKTDVCLTCHQDTHPTYRASPHAKAGLDCTSCHDIHAGDRAESLLTTDNVSETCKECHADAVAKFSLNERHRLQEGAIDCTSCHNPHAAEGQIKLGGFKQAACLECHTDKQGPFVYEHGSVLVEGCTSCHEPHGSVNRHQLKFQKVGELC